MSNFYNPTPILSLVAIVPTLYQVVGGAAGWIVTDISAVVPTSAKAVVFQIDNGNVAQQYGVRKTGSTVARNTTLQIGQGRGCCDMCECVPAQTVELYRDASLTNYWIIGYWL